MQIHTCNQHAIAIVYSYPWIAAKHKLLEVLATQRKQPPIEQYLSGNGIDDMQHALNWQQIDKYLKTLTLDNLTQHVPLRDPEEPAASNQAAANAFPRTSFDLLIWLQFCGDVLSVNFRMQAGGWVQTFLLRWFMCDEASRQEALMFVLFLWILTFHTKLVQIQYTTGQYSRSEFILNAV